MANEEQLSILKQGVKVWNKWRSENPNVAIDLSEARLDRTLPIDDDPPMVLALGFNLVGFDLSCADLTNAVLYNIDLSMANLSDAKLNGAVLIGARFIKTNLIRADLYNAALINATFHEANLEKANFEGADLRGADLRLANLFGCKFYEARLERADLSDANIAESNFSSANLSYASLIQAKVDNTVLSKSVVYGVNVWGLSGEFKEQKELIITPENEPTITVDNIKVAQFIYLILNNGEIRDLLNTLTSKSVLILGRFADDKRKAVLDALRNKLREFNLLPIVFDFDRPVNRNITETVKTLAGISYFVIADVTSPKSSPLELQAIVPDYQIPIVPIIQEGEFPFSMINDLRTQHTGLLDPLTYDSEETLIKVLKSAIIDPAIEKHNELKLIKAQNPKIRSAKDFLEKEME